MGCSPTAVVSIYQKLFKEGAVVKLQQGHGLPRLIDAQGERRLARLVESNWPATVAQITEEVNTGSDRKVSEYTVHRSLLHMGLHNPRLVSVPMLTPFYRLKCQHSMWASKLDQKARLFFCFFFYITWRTMCMYGSNLHGTRIHYGKKASQWRQCDILGNVLLGNLGSCHPYGCYFDTYNLPKHCCRKCTPFKETVFPVGQGPFQHNNAPCYKAK